MELPYKRLDPNSREKYLGLLYMQGWVRQAMANGWLIKDIGRFDGEKKRDEFDYYTAERVAAEGYPVCDPLIINPTGCREEVFLQDTLTHDL